MHPLFAIGMPGFQEWLVIGVICLIFFGPKKLPEIARAFGKSMNEFKKARDEFTAELHRSTETPVEAPRPVEQVAQVTVPATAPTAPAPTPVAASVEPAPPIASAPVAAPANPQPPV